MMIIFGLVVIQVFAQSSSPAGGTVSGMFSMSDVLSALAVLISLISLGVTSYNEYLKKPRLTVSPGENLKLFHGPKGEVAATLSCSFLNTGARYGTIYKMNVILRRGSQSASLDWRYFVEMKNVSPEGTRFTPFDIVQGFAETLVIPSRGGVAKRIQLESSTAYPLTAGEHSLELQVFFFGGKVRAPESITAAFEITNENEIKVLSSTVDPATRVSHGSIVVSLRIQP